MSCVYFLQVALGAAYCNLGGVRVNAPPGELHGSRPSAQKIGIQSISLQSAQIAVPASAHAEQQRQEKKQALLFPSFYYIRAERKQNQNGVDSRREVVNRVSVSCDMNEKSRVASELTSVSARP